MTTEVSHEENIQAAFTATTPFLYFIRSNYFAPILESHDRHWHLVATVPFAANGEMPPFADPEPIMALCRQRGELVRITQNGFIVSAQQSLGRYPGVEIEVAWA